MSASDNTEPSCSVGSSTAGSSAVGNPSSADQIFLDRLPIILEAEISNNRMASAPKFDTTDLPVLSDNGKQQIGGPNGDLSDAYDTESLPSQADASSMWDYGNLEPSSPQSRTSASSSGCSHKVMDEDVSNELKSADSTDGMGSSATPLRPETNVDDEYSLNTPTALAHVTQQEQLSASTLKRYGLRFTGFSDSDVIGNGEGSSTLPINQEPEHDMSTLVDAVVDSPAEILHTACPRDADEDEEEGGVQLGYEVPYSDTIHDVHTDTAYEMYSLPIQASPDEHNYTSDGGLGSSITSPSYDPTPSSDCPTSDPLMGLYSIPSVPNSYLPSPAYEPEGIMPSNDYFDSETWNNDPSPNFVSSVAELPALSENEAMDLTDDGPTSAPNGSVSPPDPAIILFPNGATLPPHLLASITQHPFNIIAAATNANDLFGNTWEDDSAEWPGPLYHGDYERNLSFKEFCTWLSHQYAADPMQHAMFKISNDHAEVVALQRPRKVSREDVEEHGMDHQGIPWRKLDMERERYRALRNRKYSNYTNMKPYPEPVRVPRQLRTDRHYLRFKKTSNTVGVRFSHFQLRNVMSAVSKNDVYYSGESVVMRFDPSTSQTETIMDMRRTQHGDSLKITSLASDYGILIAGGFYGEYAMKSLDSPMRSRPIEGLVTTDSNGITNHVHFFRSRSSGLPQAVFSSNDERLRILDCYTNKMVGEHKMPWAINCSATSPCGRLRAIVGDSKEVVIHNTDTGEILHELPGHQDYGFACAWSEDGYTIATGNQDMMIRIYDARNFKQTVAVLDADLAGARSVRFSPLGSGPRVLAFAEPADMVSIVDAVTWERRQRIDFFGETAGISFSPDGRDFYIANSDRTVGGIMQFDRWKNDVNGYDDEALDEAVPSLAKRRMNFRDCEPDYLGSL